MKRKTYFFAFLYYYDVIMFFLNEFAYVLFLNHNKLKTIFYLNTLKK